MNFEERFEQVIKDRGVPKKELARKLDIPYSSFLYKAKHLNAWNVPEFQNMVKTLRLTDEEVVFLATEVN